MRQTENEIYIQITGEGNDGKDYIASKLKDRYESRGKTVSILRFADPLKEILSATLGVSLEELEERKRDTDITGGVGGLNSIRGMHEGLSKALKKFMYSDCLFSDELWYRAENSGSEVIITPDLRYRVEKIYESFVIHLGNSPTEFEVDLHIKDQRSMDTTLVLDIIEYEVQRHMEAR